MEIEILNKRDLRELHLGREYISEENQKKFYEFSKDEEAARALNEVNQTDYLAKLKAKLKALDKIAKYL